MILNCSASVDLRKKSEDRRRSPLNINVHVSSSETDKLECQHHETLEHVLDLDIKFTPKWQRIRFSAKTINIGNKVKDHAITTAQ